MKALCKILAVLVIAGGLLALAAALFVREQKTDYICLYGDPAEE